MHSPIKTDASTLGYFSINLLTSINDGSLSSPMQNNNSYYKEKKNYNMEFLYFRSEIYHRILHCEKGFEITEQIGIDSIKWFQYRNGRIWRFAG